MSVTWKDILGQVAPTIATALGVPPMVTGALTWVGEKVFGTPGQPATQDGLESAITGGDPQVLIKLKQADLDYQAHLADLGVQMETLGVQDRGSARALAIARGIWPQVGVSVIVLLGYFSTLWVLISGEVHIPTEVHDLVVELIGALSTGVGMVLTFWLGSTHGSQKKDSALVSAVTGT